MSDRAELGRKVQTEMFGEAFVDRLDARRAQQPFGAIVSEHAQASCFGDIWSRPELDRRSRSIATIAMLMALKTPNELKNHIKGGIANGLTVKEIEELMLHGAAYLGYPTVAVAQGATREALTEIGVLPVTP